MSSSSARGIVERLTRGVAVRAATGVSISYFPDLAVPAWPQPVALPVGDVPEPFIDLDDVAGVATDVRDFAARASGQAAA